MSTSPSIQQSLSQTYQRTNWQHLLHSLFPDGTVRLFATPQRLTASQEKVKTTLQLGTIDLADGTTIALLEVETTDQVKLARNRVGLRNFVSTFIDEAGASAVLAVFHQKKSDDWRLTYAARQTTLDEETSAIVTIETAPRRFTFVLGKNEPCRTAAARLATILEKGDELTLPVVEKAFSVETLSKDFFKKYKEHYQAFVTHQLASTRQAATRKTFGIPALTDSAEQEKADKPVRDFVKTLLGRLVFLHFLQKKGWLGCKAGTKAWVGGDPDFLQSLFTMAGSRKEAPQFHSKYLSPLFFEALNMPERAGDIFALTNSRLPYLNGGLFEEESAPLRALDFPQDLFANILDFFGEYNFTIDENDPEDHEVGIDPEMLGHIFENLLEDNKDKGAFYTPKPSVSYMARQSLLHYLQTHLGEFKELEILLNEKDPSNHQGKDSFVAANRERIAELLDAVKICDPAIGSGAFPIGLLQEILWTRLALQPELNTSADRARLKRQIIQNSIHGVDIDPGAIEIARLRFWLALVVDEDEPRPLPNLDYKIHRADSLIEYIRGEPVNLGNVHPNDSTTRAALDNLIAAKQSLFTAQRLQEKRAAWFDLYRSLAQLAQAEFTWLRNGTNFDDGERLSQLTRGIKEFGQWIGQIDAVKKEKAQLQDVVLGKLKQWFDDPNKPTFLWNLHFGEIFSSGGFDIVIANPPYLLLQDGVGSLNYRSLVEENYKKYVAYKIDLYHAFIGLIPRLCRKSGVACYIVPSNFRTNNYCDGLRKRLSSDLSILQIVIFDEQVFQASVNNLILTAKNLPPSPGHKLEFVNCKDQNSLVRPGLGFTPCLQDPYQDGRPLVPISSGNLALIERMASSSQRLGSIATVSFGMQLRDRSKFPSDVIKPTDKTKLTPYHRLCVTGRNIKRFCVSYTNLYCYFNREAKAGGCWDEILHMSKGKILTPQIGRIPDFAIDKEGRPLLNTAFMIVCNHEDSRFVVAILNSNPLGFFWLTRFSDDRKQFPKVKGTYLKDLPIPKASGADKKRLIALADSCAEAAEKSNHTSLAILETEINQIVYRLFDLTTEEIAVIEAAVNP
jgi:hypothetical protein